MTGNPRRGRFPPKLLRSENADLKFSTNNGETDDNKNPRSRENIADNAKQKTTPSKGNKGDFCYSDHKHVRHHTITLQTKPMKRGNTDCRRFKKMPPIEFATKAMWRSLRSKLSYSS